MKINSITQCLIRLILLLFVAGCASNSTIEGFPSPVPTYTVVPTQIVALTRTPTLTIKPTLIEATSINTMTSEEQKNFFRGFLSDSGNCSLPCWWNITPDQTWEDAIKSIQGYGGFVEPVFPGHDPETTVYGVGGLPITGAIHDSGSISFEEKHGLVYASHISSTGGVENPEEFRRVWKNYLAQKIVTMYGMPDRILLHGDPASNSLQYGIYSLWLFYDELGFSVLYEARIPMYFFGAPFFRICSETDPLLNIKLHTQSPNNTLPLDRFDRTLEEVRLGTDIGKVIVIHSLQDATGLDDKEIYDTFIQNEEACFAMPSDIWKVK